MNYRETKKIKEIISSFYKSAPKDTFVWQNIRGIRQIYYPMDLDIREHLGTVNMIFKQEPIEFDPDDYFYIKMSHNNSICKTRLLTKIGNELALYLPESMQSIENRHEPRYGFSSKEKKTATIRISSDITSSSTQTVQLQVSDISEGGMGAITQEMTHNALKFSKVYVLTHLGDITLPEPILLDKVYFKTADMKKKGKLHKVFRYGFKTKDQLDSNIIQNYISV